MQLKKELKSDPSFYTKRMVVLDFGSEGIWVEEFVFISRLFQRLAPRYAKDF